MGGMTVKHYHKRLCLSRKTWA